MLSINAAHTAASSYLRVQAGVLPDDLDGHVVCADCAVRAHPPEEALHRVRGNGGDGAMGREGGEVHVVVDADGEVPLRNFLHRATGPPMPPHMFQQRNDGVRDANRADVTLKGLYVMLTYYPGSVQLS